MILLDTLLILWPPIVSGYLDDPEQYNIKQIAGITIMILHNPSQFLVSLPWYNQILKQFFCHAWYLDAGHVSKKQHHCSSTNTKPTPGFATMIILNTWMILFPHIVSWYLNDPDNYDIININYWLVSPLEYCINHAHFWYHYHDTTKDYQFFYQEWYHDAGHVCIKNIIALPFILGQFLDSLPWFYLILCWYPWLIVIGYLDDP